MRILVITNLFYPDRGGGASVFSDLCFGLAERGWQVTVYATHPYYPEWHRKSEANPWRVQEETIRGVKVRRHGIYIPRNPSKLGPRVLFEASFGASLLRSLWSSGRFDVNMVFCPTLSSVWFAAVRSFVRNEPLWLNVQDIPADAAAGTGISRLKWFNAAAGIIQRHLFNCADVWSSISPVMVNRLSGMRTRNQPLLLCSNWLHESMAASLESMPSKRGLSLSTPLRLLYAGNIGKKQGLLEFCQAMAASQANFRFSVYGNGGESESVQRWITDSKDARFSYGAFLDENAFVKALHLTDLFVITERDGAGASFIPSKLIPAIASGTPILAVCDPQGPLGCELREFDLGLQFRWTHLNQIHYHLENWITNQSILRKLQENCISRAAFYERNASIERIDGLLRKYCVKRSRQHYSVPS